MRDTRPTIEQLIEVFARHEREARLVENYDPQLLETELAELGDADWNTPWRRPLPQRETR